MIVGPTKALLMDEISTRLDSSTAFQVVTCLQQLVHITDSTALISLLQPAPETFNLFDDVILMAEGKIVYHGPCSHALQFFEDCGFKASDLGRKLDEQLSKPYDKSSCHDSALPFSICSLRKWELFKACMAREMLLMKKNTFVYVFKTAQVSIHFNDYTLQCLCI